MDTKRAAGLLLHPTAFFSEHGIGGLGREAYEFIDFLVSAGQSYWQILPTGHTSFGDSPYQCLSAFAGNPLLICPDELVKLGLLSDGDITAAQHNIGKSLLDTEAVNYGAVISYKKLLLIKAYEFFKAKGSEKLKTEYARFCRINKKWLEDYAFFVAYKEYLIKKRKYEYESKEFFEYSSKFCKTNKNYIKDCYYGAAWNSWPDEIRKRSGSAMTKARLFLDDEIGLNFFIQFMFELQWKALKAYANKNGIWIIGDIPIFVALDSADVWRAPELFRLNADGVPLEAAGAPPDDFSETGQLWGNPLYDWDKHALTGYRWWIERITHQLDQNDILRIDHFRGFESYWSIAAGEETAVNGLWKKGPGKAFFDQIKNAVGGLPFIAEDLGIITPKVDKLRSSLNLPGMKILQYAFNDDPLNPHKPHNFKSSNTVVYTGTHDNDTTIGWYRAQDEKTKDKFRRYTNSSGKEASWDMIRIAMLSTASLAVIPIQDVLELDSKARFNYPGVTDGNWQFRIPKGALTDRHAAWLRYLTELSDRLPDEPEDSCGKR